jgi:2-polyprenyl-3-methyl-5-hydroxy-6-metoxy-1,4-benzoquinol methylase
MKHTEVKRYWDGNAAAWTQLARAGYDVYRDYLNAPAFFAMLPSIEGLCGLDIGCGEGHKTRLLAKCGASITAVDISEAFVQDAKRLEVQGPLGIDYLAASGVDLPFVDSAKVPHFTRTLSQWLNRLIETGFFLEQIEEPRPSDQMVSERPDLQDAQVVAYFLHVRARKLNKI